MRKVLTFWGVFLLLGNLIFAQPNTDLTSLKDAYFKENRYKEFIDYLKNLKGKNPADAEINYFLALSYYKQLKYLEETQNWEEYFNDGNTYRQELVNCAQQVIDTTKSLDKLNLYAQLLLWQFYKDQNNPLEASTKKALLESCNLYAQGASDKEPLKEIAQIFSDYAEKIEAQKLFKLYVQGLVASEKDLEKIKELANSYLKDNSEISILLYDAYIQRLLDNPSMPKETVIKELLTIAKNFSFNYNSENDLEYAEKLFKQMETLFGKDVFDEETLYLRGYNLERLKKYPLALEEYLYFLKSFADSKYAEKVTFKSGIIYTYSKGDIEKGRHYFKSLAEKESPSWYVFSSLYQLGLLSQWQKDFSQAEIYYNDLLKRADDSFKELKDLAQKRIEELKSDGQLEYNLKIFMDLCLNKESMLKGSADFKITEKEAQENKIFHFCAEVLLPQSGCMSVETNYLWSGTLGSKDKVLPQESEFESTYQTPGTRIVNLVVVTPSGTLDKTYLMFDIES